MTEYVKHKIRMEALVLELAPRAFIFRLPQLVGVVNNLTLVSFLFRSVIGGQNLTIHRLARRALLDVSDLVRIVERIVVEDFGVGTVINVAPSSSVLVEEIVEEIFALVEKRVVCSFLPGGDNHRIDSSSLKGFLELDDPIFAENYWKEVLKKYAPHYLSLYASARPGSSI